MVDINEKTMEIIKSILRNNDNIKRTLIFGSRVTGKSKANSDIDLVVFGDLTFRDISRLKGEFEESSCIYKVDIVHYDKIEDKDFKKNIDLYGKEIEI
jgi:predicted nucleotidyltransferase